MHANFSFFQGLFIQAMLPIALLVGAGAWWRRKLGPDGTAKARSMFSDVVIDLFCPSLLFAIAASTPLTWPLLYLPLLISIGVALSFGVLYLLFFVLPWFQSLPAVTRATLVLCGMFGNTFYLGIPILTTMFGEQAVRYPAFTDMIASIPLVWSLGVWVCVGLGRHSATPQDVSVLRIIVRLPLMWAFVLGLAFNLLGWANPALLHACRLIGQATVPVMLLVFGLSIPWDRLRLRLEVGLALMVKLVLMPVLVLLAAWALGIQRQELGQAGIIEAAMPTFLTSIAMAERFGGDVETASMMIGWGMLGMWVSLPILLYALGH